MVEGTLMTPCQDKHPTLSAYMIGIFVSDNCDCAVFLFLILTSKASLI